MARTADAMAVYDETLASFVLRDPWDHRDGAQPVYRPNCYLLEDLLAVAVRAGARSESGVFPKGVDLWLSTELRRAGFGDEETWPRSTRPRVFPREIALLLDELPTRLRGYQGLDLRAEIQRRVNEIAAITPADAKILGRAYDKQVDVCVSRWERGPEILISTKAQLSSFGKNLPNRFEEAYGDAANLRARYPLAAVGFFFVQRATILQEEPDAFERAKDMMRKLRAEGDGPGYTATGLCLVDWDDDHEQDERQVSVSLDAVPEDLRPDQFMERMVGQVLRVTPISHHVRVRERYEGRQIPVEESDEAVMAGPAERGEITQSGEPLF